MKMLFDSKRKKQVWLAIGFVLTIGFALLVVRLYSARSTDCLFVMIRSKNVIESNNKIIFIHDEKAMDAVFKNTKHIKCVCYSGGEMCSGIDILNIISRIWRFEETGILIDGEPYHIYTSDPSWPYWWHKEFPKRTIVITVLKNHCCLRETGDLVSDNRERERLCYERFKRGDKKWKTDIDMSGAAFAFGELRRELERRLGAGEKYSISIRCNDDGLFLEVINILRICKKYNLKYVFLSFWGGEEWAPQNEIGTTAGKGALAK